MVKEVKIAFLSGQPQTIEELEEDYYKFKYISALISEGDDEEKWWNSYVIGITYAN